MESTAKGASPPGQALMNPIAGTTLDTSPSSLGLHQQPSNQSASPTTVSSDGEQEGSKGLLTKALDRLSMSRSKSPTKSERKPSVNKKSKRVSISAMTKKIRSKSIVGDDAGGVADSDGNVKSGSERPADEHTASSVPSSRAPSPGPPAATQSQQLPARPNLGSLVQGDASMRMGTQTLIQALQSIPWDEDREEEVHTAPRPPLGSRQESGFSSGSDDDDPDSRRDFLSSSIHAIHRPVARFRRMSAGPKAEKMATSGYFSPPSESEIVSEGDENEADVDDEDLDERHEDKEMKSATLSRVSGIRPDLPPQTQVLTMETRPLQPSPSATTIHANPISKLSQSVRHGGDMATIRLRRKARLAHKLQDVFALREVEEVIAEMPCWLLRSVLLQGYMYVTTKHLCFFAHMPAREDQVLKSSSLSKKASRTKRWNKYWFVLKNEVLSWYSSSADPYFPHGNVDLRYATSCEAVGEKEFKLRTTQKSIHLSADSVPSRDEWVKAIKKVMFKAQNLGESVKIALPFSAMVDVEVSTAMDFSRMIEVKVMDKEDYFAIDSYFFTYFHDLDVALKQIKDALEHYKSTMEESDVLLTHGGSVIPPGATIRDTTKAAVTGAAPYDATPPTLAPAGSQAASAANVTSPPTRFGHLTSLLSLSSKSSTTTSPGSSHTALAGGAEHPGRKSEAGEDFTHVNYHPGESNPAAAGNTDLLLRPAAASAPQLPIASPKLGDPTTPTPQNLKSFPATNHTYPPHSTQQEIGEFSRIHISDAQGRPVPETSSSSLLGEYVPGWMKSAPKNPLKMFSSPNSTSPADLDHEATPRMNSEPAFEKSPKASQEWSDVHHEHNEMGFSMMEHPAVGDITPEALDPVVVDKFRMHFALDEKEQLLSYFPGYVVRLLPLFGRVYISTNHFCYRSSQPLRKTMIKVPLSDILSADKCRAFRFGHHGLCIVIKGHEEIFFEFSSVERRAACMSLLQSALDGAHNRVNTNALDALSQSTQDALILEELEPSGYMDADVPRPPPESDTIPAVMFTSHSSTFLAFKPQEPMHITCLTIGSRGDCQPYISLCKRLQADGHRCRIATHVEYKDWIEGHGIEYGAVGGDPAELMRICVENGMFTYGFLKEGLSKFRGWLDDLLLTSWQACQGTDLLIESPSAMAGIHIGEALRIPYFRAFTMPWSRTRAYPHAFAVPERKMGGSYNYMTYVMFDQVFWRAISGQINRWRRNTLGISSTTFDGMEQHKVPFLYNFSPSVVPPPLDWYEWIRITGYWFLDDADDSSTKKWTPPADLVSFIDSAHNLGKKVVYIGFGSIVVSDPEAMTRAVVEAIEQSGVYAILSKGWSDRLSTKKNDVRADVPEIKLPPQIYPIQSIPHDWLFPKIDAACHHGGAGTTGASLRAGIPTIIKPFFGDQFFWAERVEALDVGSCVRKLTVDHLTEALRAATTDVKQIQKAKLIGQKIRAEKGADNAVEAIYRDLEYARSLIKQPSTPGHGPVEDIEATTPKLEDTPEHSAGGSNNDSNKSDWSMLSGSEADSAEHGSSPGLSREGSPTPVHNAKRASISGAFSALMPKPNMMRRVSASSDRAAHGKTTPTTADPK